MDIFKTCLEVTKQRQRGEPLLNGYNERRACVQLANSASLGLVLHSCRLLLTPG